MDKIYTFEIQKQLEEVKKMGWLRGFEPPASGTTNQRSNQLSYSHHKKNLIKIYIFLKKNII